MQRWSIALLIVISACTVGTGDATSTTAPLPPTPSVSTPTPTSPANALSPTTSTTIPAAPVVPSGDLDSDVVASLDALFGTISEDINRDALRALAEADDARIAWLLADLLRFLVPGSSQTDAMTGFESLTGFDISRAPVPWVTATNALISWDTPAPPGYVRWKGQLFSAIDPRWEPFFDPQATIDYRFLSWGGVRPDDRPLGRFDEPCEGGCIPALDDPAVTDAEGGAWYADDAIVFGVVINDESRAYPKNIMEVHEMVIDTIGGVRIGMPYCTLCGSAQAYDLNSVPSGVEPPLLRTSGLLVRSNKLMFDLNTYSAFDTFTGKAVSGPLLAAEVQLDQISVVVSTWADWRRDHPETTIVARDGGIGATYLDDPLRGRDANGPIFPIGPVDPSLPVQEPVLGVVTPDGEFIAFPVAAATARLASGQAVRFDEVELVLDGSGLRANIGETELVAHESFWFAWSQFHPSTRLWQDGLEG